MRLGVIVGFALWLGFACSAKADDASRLRVAREVVQTAHVADNMHRLFPQIVAQMKPLLVQQGGADPKMVEAFIQQFLQRSDESVGAFTDLAAEVYAREFSEDDLSALLGFYETPAGQRFVAKQPEITKGMLVIGQQWGQAMARQVIEDFQKQKAKIPPKT